MSAPQPGPVTDSPLFWLLLFGSVGLVMLTAVEPKFIKRQERIERMHQSRQRAHQPDERGADDAGLSREAAETPAWRPDKQASLRPLMLFLAAVLAVAMIVLHVRRKQAIAAYRRAAADAK